MYRRGQLFLIEVIVGLTVLIILVTTLFSVQTFTPPQSTSLLDTRAEAIIQSLEDSGAIYKYFYSARQNYLQTNSSLDNTNSNKTLVGDTISSSIPLIGNYKAFTYSQIGGSWTQIDVVHFDASLPSGTDFTVVEFYCPGIYGSFTPFKFQLYLWYEVNV